MIMNDDFDKFLGVLLGGYLIAVFYNGNSEKLFSALSHERGYLEFVIALVVLYYLLKYDKTGIVATFCILGGTALALQNAGKINLGNATDKFAKGQIGLLDYATELFRR